MLRLFLCLILCFACYVSGCLGSLVGAYTFDLVGRSGAAAMTQFYFDQFGLFHDEDHMFINSVIPFILALIAGLVWTQTLSEIERNIKFLYVAFIVMGLLFIHLGFLFIAMGLPFMTGMVIFGNTKSSVMSVIVPVSLMFLIFIIYFTYRLFRKSRFYTYACSKKLY